MPILRAGPWGNLTDSFQPVPLNTGAFLDHYPVNVAKGNWPNQIWAAYYELTERGCCTPDELDFDFYDGFVSLTGTLERDPSPPYYTGSNPDCEAYTWTDGTYTAYFYWETTGYGSYPCSPSYPNYPAGWVFDMYEGSYSILYGVNENATDRCDPTGTYYELFSCPRDVNWRAIVTLPTP